MMIRLYDHNEWDGMGIGIFGIDGWDGIWLRMGIQYGSLHDLVNARTQAGHG
jgi:hypothetical protein